MNGPDLLTRYRTTASEDAFAELVRGYANLVYSIARRRLTNSSLAEEAAQTVFTRLAKALPQIKTEAELVAWLHRATVYVSIDLWRSEGRRRTREQQAAAMQPETTINNQAWDEIAPHLDEALNELSDGDRQVVLLRFFERKPMLEIGRIVGVSEDAAKMRVSRAIDRLRSRLVSRGVSIAVIALAATIAERAVEAAPASLIVRLGSMRGVVTSGGSNIFAPLLSTKNIKLLVAASVLSIVLLVMFRSRQRSIVEDADQQLQNQATAPEPRSKFPLARRAVAGAQGSDSVLRAKTRLVFRVLDSRTGQGLFGAQIRAAYFYPGGRGEGHSLVTDQNGEAGIPEPDEGGNPGMNVFVSAEGYVPKAIMFGRKAPPEYVLRVETAAMAAGIVVDERGMAVAGVKLEASRSEEHKNGEPNTDFQTVKVETDANGRWRYPYIPRSYEEVAFNLTAEEYAVTRAEVRMGTPESTNATLIIKRGFAVAGRVTDSQGSPIVKAKVKEFHNYGHRKLSAETADDGSFLLLGVSHPDDSKAEIVVQAEGMAPQLQTIQLRDPTNIINFALTNGNVFRGHVVDETGQFIPGAAVQTDSDNQGRRPFQWFTHTDVQGGFLWDSAPADPVLFWFEAEGYEPIRDLLLKADGREYEIKLKRKPK